jgi:hypothetical protein
MQIVDVLRDQPGHFPRLVERGEREMAPAGRRLGEIFFHGETPLPRLIAHLLTGDEIVEINRLIFGPDAARGTEIRDPAFGRDSGAGEGHNRVRAIDQFAQTRYALVEIGLNHR